MSEIYCVAVRGVGCKRSYPYYAAGLYRLVRRTKDGRSTWRCVQTVGQWRRSLRLAQNDAEWYATTHGLECRYNIRHGTPLVRSAV